VSRKENKPLALAVRVSPALLQRIDALVPTVAESELELTSVNRSVVVRKALLLGLDALERQSMRPDVQTSSQSVDPDEGL
jgi:hypothetical protein